MPKGTRTKTAAAWNTQYLFYQCPCGWDCIVDNIKDVKRAKKLRMMKVKCHLKKCTNPPKAMEQGNGCMPQLNGSYLSGRDAQNLMKYTQGYDVRKLINYQFPETKITE
jgi:hypothetical protein